MKKTTIVATQEKLTDFLIQKVNDAFDKKQINFCSKDIPVGFLFISNISRNLRLDHEGFLYFSKFFWHKELKIGDFVLNTKDLSFIHAQHQLEPYYLHVDKKTQTTYITTFNEDFCFEYLLNGGLRNLMDFKK